MTSTCEFHFKSFEMVTPNNLICLKMSTGWSLITTDGKEGGLAEKLTRNSFVFEAFNFILFAHAPCSHWLTVDGMSDWESLETISHVVESSTYLTRSKDDLRTQFCPLWNSSVNAFPVRELMINPCPLQPVSGKESGDPIDETRMTSICWSFLSRLLWSIWSNALEKSNKQIRRDDPKTSDISYHLCNDWLKKPMIRERL